MQHLFPHKLVADIHEYPNRDAFKEFLMADAKKYGPRAEKHTSSPFTWTADNTFVGGCDDTLAYCKNTFFSGVSKPARPTAAVDSGDSGTYDYDLIVIGGGSGGLACSKEAASTGAKVACLDFVKPSPAGTTWGLGGTCVNVGCIPKKLCHQAALVGEFAKDAKAFGWNITNSGHDWTQLVENIQDHIHGLNFNYRVDLRDKKVDYLNMLGSFVDPHTIECTNPRKQSKTITAKRIVIAVGGRPNQLEIPGGELALSSDDIFSLETPPGKCLVVGASYIALECGGFLTGCGYDTTIMVRSIFLRGFDQDMANRIGSYMEEEGTKFIRKSVPSKIEKQANGKLKVTWTAADGSPGGSDEFDTVLSAVGRYADTTSLGLDKAGVATDKKGKIPCNNEQTNVPHIYAIGDVVTDMLELTPVAIQSGQMLARRMFGVSDLAMDYDKIPTTVFTPLEYGCCGLSEEDATARHGSELEVFHQAYTPLEWALPEPTPKHANKCYMKLLCDKVRRFSHAFPMSAFQCLPALPALTRTRTNIYHHRFQLTSVHDSFRRPMT
jgi:thioredoxin reductase (NADPH)